ncbi:hypothetical protein Bbelb_233060, partial [Branchiostoma belcheri]
LGFIIYCGWSCLGDKVKVCWTDFHFRNISHGDGMIDSLLDTLSSAELSESRQPLVRQHTVGGGQVNKPFRGAWVTEHLTVSPTVLLTPMEYMCVKYASVRKSVTFEATAAELADRTETNAFSSSSMSQDVPRRYILSSAPFQVYQHLQKLAGPGRIGIFEALVLRTILRVLSLSPQAPVPGGSPHSRPDPTVFPTLSPYRGYFCGGAIAVGPSARGDTEEPARHGMKFGGAAPCQSQSTYARYAGVNEACSGASFPARGTERGESGPRFATLSVLNQRCFLKKAADAGVMAFQI